MTATGPDEREVRAARRFGWTSFLVWVLVGLGIEVAHGFKLSAYLDDGLTRTLLRLGHAHGVILSLGVLVYSLLAADPARSAAPPRAGRMLRAAAVLIPAGFTLSAFGRSEGDPSLPIFLVPLGAGALIAGAFLMARGAWRR